MRNKVIHKFVSIMLVFILTLSSAIFISAHAEDFDSDELEIIDPITGEIIVIPSTSNNNQNSDGSNTGSNTNTVNDTNSTTKTDDIKDPNTVGNLDNDTSDNNSSTNDTNPGSSENTNTDKSENTSSTVSNAENISGSNVINNNNNDKEEFSHDDELELDDAEKKTNTVSFSDVGQNAWYVLDVAKATELGLINGYDGKFYPDNYLTYSEAIKLAACMHQLKTTGKITLVNGTKNWYDTYVEYAKQNKIISKDYDWTANATRAGYVEIFAHALPDDALSAKNIVTDGAIPDVATSDYAAAEIYKLYRAGILTGSDAKGTFNPDSNILRCEVAAILTRMMDESARKTISLS